MDILGKTKIYRKDFDGKPVYSTSIGRKNQYGNYENMYVQVQLPKDVELQDKTDINITKGFISWYKSKDLPKIKLVVMEFEIEEKYIAEEREAIQNESNYNFSDDEFEKELPFR